MIHHETKLLLIDDDPYFGELFTKYATSRGVRVDYFESLLDASYVARLDRYDAAIVDCCIPGCNGFEISQYFQTFFKHVKVIMISASESSKSQFEKSSFGAEAYVPKTLGMEAIIEVALGRQKGASHGFKDSVA